MKILAEAEKRKPAVTAIVPYKPYKYPDPDPTPPMPIEKGRYPVKTGKPDYQAIAIKSRLDFDRGIDKLVRNYPVHIGGVKLDYQQARLFYYQLSATNEDSRRTANVLSAKESKTTTPPLIIRTGGWDEFD